MHFNFSSQALRSRNQMHAGIHHPALARTFFSSGRLAAAWKSFYLIKNTKGKCVQCARTTLLDERKEMLVICNSPAYKVTVHSVCREILRKLENTDILNILSVSKNVGQLNYWSEKLNINIIDEIFCFCHFNKNRKGIKKTQNLGIL